MTKKEHPACRLCPCVCPCVFCPCRCVVISPAQKHHVIFLNLNYTIYIYIYININILICVCVCSLISFLETLCSSVSNNMPQYIVFFRRMNEEIFFFLKKTIYRNSKLRLFGQQITKSVFYNLESSLFFVCFLLCWCWLMVSLPQWVPASTFCVNLVNDAKEKIDMCHVVGISEKIDSETVDMTRSLKGIKKVKYEIYTIIKY